MTRRAFALLTVALMLSASSAWAQTQAVFTGVGIAPRRISGFDLATATVQWEMPTSFPIANWIVSGSPAISHDGRYAVWPARTPEFVGGLVMRDLTSGALAAAPFPSYIFSLTHAKIIVAHPRRLVFYAQLAGGELLIIEPYAVRVVQTCFRPADAALTLDGSQLFIACDDNRLLVWNTASESVDRQITLQTAAIRLEVNGDGSRVATIADAPGDNGWEFALRDGTSGAVLATRFIHAPWSAGLASNSDRTKIYASFEFTLPDQTASRETRVYSFDTLSNIATLPDAFFSMAFTPDGHRALAVAPIGEAFGNTQFCRVYFVDTVADSLQESYRAYCDGAFPNVQLVAPPLTPSHVSVTVTGRRVAFSWQLPPPSPGATQFAIDARREPDGPVIATVLTGSDASTFSIDDIPSGTYFVRVRATNAVGSSSPSAEQRIVVP